MGSRELGRFVRHHREDRGLTQLQLGEQVGVSHTYVSKIEHGHATDIGYDVLRNLAEALGVAVEDLDRLLYDRPTPHRAPLPEPTREVPALPIAKIAAGPRGRSSIIEHWEYVPLSQTRGHILRAAVVDGDCLEPEIHPGDTVIFDQNPSPRDGQLVVAVLLDEGDGEKGKGVLKRFYKLNGKVKLAPNVGEPLILPADRVKIEGVVVEVRRRYAA